MKVAVGTISPKISTKVTETMTAAHEGTRLSRKMGIASFAAALKISSVHRRK